MNDVIKTNLRAMWVMAALLALTLPVFVPSLGSLDPFTNVIGTSVVTMFILSFPAGIFAVPLMFLIDNLFGVDPDTIGGQYLSVWMFAAVGAVQWFFIVPRLWRKYRANESRRISVGEALRQINEGEPAVEHSGHRPLEKVLDE